LRWKKAPKGSMHVLMIVAVGYEGKMEITRKLQDFNRKPIKRLIKAREEYMQMILTADFRGGKISPFIYEWTAMELCSLPQSHSYFCRRKGPDQAGRKTEQSAGHRDLYLPYGFGGRRTMD